MLRGIAVRGAVGQLGVDEDEAFDEISMFTPMKGGKSHWYARL
jgi:hypothetical protein